MTIRNPIEWSGAQLVSAAHAAERFHRSLHHISETIHSPMPVIRRIGTQDVWRSLGQGVADFEAYRSDVIFLCATYALVGLVIARLALGGNLLPLLFPLASGFAIVGPLAALGLYEMSRRREQGASVSWINAFDVLKAPALGQIAVLGLLLIAVFLAWLGAAWLIFDHTLGPTSPPRSAPFLHDVFFTPAGRLMLVAGIGGGLLLRPSGDDAERGRFPAAGGPRCRPRHRDQNLLPRRDRKPKAHGAMGIAGGRDPGAGHGAVVFVGLMVAVPVLGHATWHLYRKLVVPA